MNKSYEILTHLQRSINSNAIEYHSRKARLRGWKIRKVERATTGKKAPAASCLSNECFLRSFIPRVHIIGYLKKSWQLPMMQSITLTAFEHNDCQSLVLDLSPVLLKIKKSCSFKSFHLRLSFYLSFKKSKIPFPWDLKKYIISYILPLKSGKGHQCRKKYYCK